MRVWTLYHLPSYAKDLNDFKRRGVFSTFAKAEAASKGLRKPFIRSHIMDEKED